MCMYWCVNWVYLFWLPTNSWFHLHHTFMPLQVALLPEAFIVPNVQCCTVCVLMFAGWNCCKCVPISCFLNASRLYVCVVIHTFSQGKFHKSCLTHQMWKLCPLNIWMHDVYKNYIYKNPNDMINSIFTYTVDWPGVSAPCETGWYPSTLPGRWEGARETKAWRAEPMSRILSNQRTFVNTVCYSVHGLPWNFSLYITCSKTVCTLSFVGFIFRGFFIFADFTFLDSWMVAIVPCVSIDA